MVPTRGGLPGGFGATLKLTVPFPAPLGKPTIEIHGLSADAVHGHVRFVVTEKLPEPPSAVKFCDVGVSVYAHGAPAA